MAKVSVVIPHFRCKQALFAQTLRSVITQTHRQIEIVVVDDGSDLPFSGLDAWAEFQTGNIVWIKQEKNGGVAAARNRGIKESSGEFIAFLDAGDWWSPEKIERQLQQLHQKNVDWVYCGAVLHTNDGRTTEIHPTVEGDAYSALLRGQCIVGSCSAVLLQRSLIQEVGGFFDEYDVVEDWDLWLRIGRRHPVAFVEECLTHLLVEDPSSRSWQVDAKRVRLERFINLHAKEYAEAGLTNYIWAKFHLRIGQVLLMNGQAIKGLLSWAKVIYLRPSLYPWKSLPVALASIIYPGLYARFRRWRIK